MVEAMLLDGDQLMVEDVVLEDTLTAQDNTDKYNQGIKILKSR